MRLRSFSSARATWYNAEEEEFFPNFLIFATRGGVPCVCLKRAPRKTFAASFACKKERERERERERKDDDDDELFDEDDFDENECFVDDEE